MTISAAAALSKMNRTVLAKFLFCAVLGSGFFPLLHASGTGERYLNSKLPLILDRPAGLPQPMLPFRSYGADMGLGNFAVRRIVQDTVGFLWAGTEDGLYRYDGDRFTRFDSSKGLPSTWITDLLATPDGGLWVCTPQGLSKQEGDRFVAVGSESSGLPAGSCNAIARDGRGAIWIAQKDGVFFQHDDRFVRVPGLPAGPSTAVVSSPESAEVVFAAVNGTVVRIVNSRVKQIHALWSRSAEPIDSLAVDRSGRLWAQSARKLFCLQPGMAEFTQESIGIPAISSRGVLSTDRGGRLWVPTDEGMSCRVGDKWEHFGLGDGLPTDWTRYVFEDREGSFWIASLGLHRLIGGGSWISWTRAQGLPSDTVWDIYRSRRGDLWVATDKGLCLANPAGWRVLPGTAGTVVRRIHEDSRGRIWIGLVPAGILRYDPATGQISKYGSSAGVTGARVLCLQEDADGQLWAATDRSGLLRFVAEKNSFVRQDVPDGTPDETFRYLLRDRGGRLWATGEHGLLLKSEGRWRRFGRKDGLLQDHVSYITELSSGEFWLSYFEPLGLARFALNRDGIRILANTRAGNGLSSEKVYLIGEDLSNNLWVGTGKGVDVVTPKGILHFSKADGVAGNDIDAMAFLIQSNGVFIGTSSGLSMYRGDADAELIQAPKPVLLDASISDTPLNSGDGKIPKFPHKLNTLKAEFAVLSFLHESQIEYGIRLQGLETEWHNSRFRETRYAGLAPGSYVYEVRSRIGSGPWSQPASIPFEIRQPWWGTWPAIAGWIILIGSAALAAFRWRLQHLQKRTKQLEKLVSARTIELAMANADLERLSITDPLTGLKNRRFLEFSIVEDLARIRRSFQATNGDWQNVPEESPNISFLVIDIDHFKLVNDRFGHAAGDQVLKQMGGVLSSAVRESDTTVRWGGEEFLIIARNPRGSDLAALSERIRNHVESSSFQVSEGQSLQLTCSMGYASWPFFRHEPDALGWQDVLDLADRCLYLAKNSGRNAWIGVKIRTDYRGKAEYSVLSDFRAAEAGGIVEIQSSASAATEHRRHFIERQPTDTRVTYIP